MDIKKIDLKMADAQASQDEFFWKKAYEKPFTVHGLYWINENKNYHRLRDTLETRENLKNLASHPSGAFISFRTDSTQIELKVKNASAAYMAHMSACGQGGLDLYVLKDDGNFSFINTTKINKAEYEVAIVKGMDKKLRSFRIYLPLYIELIDLEIGLDIDSILEESEPIRNDKIICYGTSISQGGCATRPGMNYSSILERMLKKYEVYNFGFSGNAHLDYEVAHDLATIDNLKYMIVESESNNTIERTNEKLENFVRIIIDKNPNLKVFIMSHFPNPYENINYKENQKLKKHKALHKKICKNLGENVTYIDGEKIMRQFGYDETVDSAHLTDLGFYFWAKYFKNLLEK